MKVCFFDIDGTLLHAAGLGRKAFEDAFASEFGITELTRGISFAGRSDRGITSDLFGHHEVEDSQQNWERFRGAYVERLDHHLPDYDGVLLSGCLSLIERIEALGDIHLGLLTGNVQGAALRKLNHYGVWNRFSFGGYGDSERERAGIAQEALEAARQHHGEPSDTEQLVVIGDTPNDVRCARAIGACAVAVATGPTPKEDLVAAEPDLLLDSLEDYEAVLAQFT